MQNITDLRKEIRALRPGYWLDFAKENGITHTVERSGNGQEIRFVRTDANGSFRVYKTIPYLQT
jgi:hypothetical protein